MLLLTNGRRKEINHNYSRAVSSIHRRESVANSLNAAGVGVDVDVAAKLSTVHRTQHIDGNASGGSAYPVSIR